MKNIIFFPIYFVMSFGSLFAQNSKLTPALQDAVCHDNANQTYKVWIFFRDKGPTVKGLLNKSLSTPEAFLSPKSIERRKKVIKSNCVVDQADLPVTSEYISQVLQTGVKRRAISRWFNGMSVEATPEQIRQIASFSFVKEIRPVLGFKRREIKEKLNQEKGVERKPLDESFNLKKSSVPSKTKAKNDFTTSSNYTLNYGYSLAQEEQINVPVLHEMGYNGSGVLVCMLDVGFRKSHQAFQHLNIVAERDFVMGDEDTQQDTSNAYDYRDDHGTATWSTAAGFIEGKLIGPAFGADFLLAKTEDSRSETPIEEDYWVAGIEWADSLGADVVSSSLGYLYWYTFKDMDGNTALCTRAADRAAGLGIVVVNAAGNERGTEWGYIVAPADGDSVIAVGAVDINGYLTSFSSPGPTYDGRIKPEVCAMGENTVCARSSRRSDVAVGSASGTSLSTPLVAGAAAVLLQVHPEWSPMEVREALINTASQHDSPDNNFGWGIINTLKASGLVIPHIVFQDYDVDDTNGNGNGWVDPGESIRFFFTLQNRGTKEASGVSARLETESPYVTLIDSFFTVDVILMDSIVTISQPFTVRIAENTPMGEVLPFQFILTDDENRTWQMEFDLVAAIDQWYVTWSESELISGNEHVPNTLSSCIDDKGVVHVIWNDGNSGRTAEAAKIFYTSQSESGWQEPVLIFSYQLGGFSRVTVHTHILPYIESLYAMLFFFEWHNWESTAYFSRWDRTGWSAPVLTLEKYPDWEIKDGYEALAVDGEGRLHVVLEYDRNVTPTFFHCIQDSSGWIRTPIDDFGYYPSMVIDSNGGLHLTYMRAGTSLNNDVFYIYSIDNGLNWSTPVEVFARPIRSHFPVIVVDSQDIRHIVWLESGVPVGEIVTGVFYHSFLRDGVYWSNPVIISNPVEGKITGREPDFIADRDGDLHLVWVEGEIFGSRWKEIYYAQWSKEEEVWSPPVAVTSDIDGIRKDRPSLTLDDLGRIHLVFSLAVNDSGGPYSIQHMVSEPVCSPLSQVLAETKQYLPSTIQLFQNYPNPFNAQTVIQYELPQDCNVKIFVYNMLGHKVRTLLNKHQTAGMKRIVWDGRDDLGKEICSGTYFVRMETGESKKVRKILLLR